jgi:hypothetical protein
MPDSSSIPDPVAALAEVTDDTAQRSEADRWAEDQLIAGVAVEDLVADLTTHGWEPSDAETIVETARKETRAARGIVTRDDIVREMNVDYRRATGGLSVAFRSGLFGLYGFTTGFMAALRTLRKLKK